MTEPAATQPIRGKVDRIEALDWTKGALVLFMVIYHAINYSAHRPLAFQYLAFLPPSFILIAGFVVGQIYATRYDLSDWRPYARLAVRGVKLLLLFAGLNIAYFILIQRDFILGIGDFTDRAAAIFISGSGRIGIFEVLLPIAYFLIISPLLLWARSRITLLIPLLGAGAIAACVVLERNGLLRDNVHLFSFGFIGLSLGLIPLADINRWASRWIPVLCFYGAYRMASYVLDERYAVQAFGAVATLLLLYCIALHLNSAGWGGRQMVRLGQYSLLGYLLQIAVLQVIVRVLNSPVEHWMGVAGLIAITVVILTGVVALLDGLRRKSEYANRAYKIVFA